MTGKRELIDEDKVNWNNKDSIIEFYNKNLLYFNNFNLLTDIESIIDITETKLAYCNALEFRHKYSMILPVLEHIENLLPKIKDSDDYDRIYEKYLFNKGFAFERLKNFNESQKCFDQLLKMHPDDELYKRWYRSNKNAIWAKQFKIIGYIGASIVFIDLAMEVIFHIKFGKIVPLIGLFLGLSGFFMEDIKNYWDKIMKK
jgi:tetratricopeptide (TPR) repeat protein